MNFEIPTGLERETREANVNHGCTFRQSKKVYKIMNLTDEEATLVEPASCAIHGLDKLNPPVGVEALIFFFWGGEVLLVNSTVTLSSEWSFQSCDRC